MGLSVNFRTQRGIITNRRFLIGEGVSIYGTARTLLGLPMANATIRIDVVDENNLSIYTKETFTNLWSDFDFWFRTPFFDKSLTVKIWATFPGGGNDYSEIPISVGGGSLKPLPNPEIEFNLFSLLPVVIIIAGILTVKKILE